MTTKLNNRAEVDGLLAQWHAGSREAYDDVIALLHDDLREIAHRQFHRERSGHSLETDDLVSQFYMKTLASKTIPWKTHMDFLRSAVRVMNQIMIDHARVWQRRADGANKLPLANFSPYDWERIEMVMKEKENWFLEWESLFKKLAEISPSAASAAELKLVLGLTHDEIADQLEMPVSKVVREWSFAKQFIGNQLGVQGY